MPAVHFYCILCGTALQTAADSQYDLTQCHCCSRYVPVPRPVQGPTNRTNYPPVFPPEVLELSIKFRCTACSSPLRVDARREGREIACPVCNADTTIPRWSTVMNWSRPGKAGEPTSLRATRPPIPLKAPTLSEAEIDFLRGSEPAKPEAAA